jgi:hypothetical protein
MDARHGKSVDTVSNFIVQLIHTTLQNKNGVAMLLLLNMARAFDRVVQALLLHNVKGSNFFEWIVK